MFKEIAFTDVKENVVDLLKNQWALVTAGDKNGFMATIYIRPQRYTVKYLEEQDYFTISVYPPELKKQIHGVCGSKSGRDTDKAKEAGITPVFDEKAPYFKEAKLVLVCRKVAKGEFKPEQFIDKSIIPAQYSQNDFHYIYYGAIEKVLINE